MMFLGGVGGPLLAERAVKIRLLPLHQAEIASPKYFLVRQRSEKLLEPMSMPLIRWLSMLLSQHTATSPPSTFLVAP